MAKLFGFSIEDNEKKSKLSSDEVEYVKNELIKHGKKLLPQAKWR